MFSGGRGTIAVYVTVSPPKERVSHLGELTIDPQSTHLPDERALGEYVTPRKIYDIDARQILSRQAAYQDRLCRGPRFNPRHSGEMTPSQQGVETQARQPRSGLNSGRVLRVPGTA